MVIRKPYAFLIKYFRQIHIVLLVLAIYIYTRVVRLSSFVNNYIDTEIYNEMVDPIKNYTSTLTYLAIILLLIGVITIIILFKQKKKPKLMYILIGIEYIVIFFIFSFSTSYFNNLHGATINSAQIRLIRDFLKVFSIFQFAVFIMLIIRILGIDLQKFGFLNDEEFLTASEADREEIEVGINIDKDRYVNTVKKSLRHFKYYYVENKFILNIVMAVLTIVFSFTVVNFILSFKTYKQGKAFNADGYEITVNDVYISKYNSGGEEIEKNKSFIILNIDIFNYYGSTKINTDKFLLMNSKDTVTPTTKYNNYFKDLGIPYNGTSMEYRVKYNYILIYKVDASFVKGKYTLYYNNNAKNIKIKINPINYSVKNKKKEYKLTDDIELPNGKLSIEEYNLVDEIDLLYDTCSVDNCYVKEKNMNAYSFGSTSKFLQLEIDSEEYEGYDFYEFLKEHAKIVYTVNNIESKVDVKGIDNINYKGDTTYIVVSNNISLASSIYLDINVRNNEYKYKLK